MAVVTTLSSGVSVLAADSMAVQEETVEVDVLAAKKKYIQATGIEFISDIDLTNLVTLTNGNQGIEVVIDLSGIGIEDKSILYAARLVTDVDTVLSGETFLKETGGEITFGDLATNTFYTVGDLIENLKGTNYNVPDMVKNGWLKQDAETGDVGITFSGIKQIALDASPVGRLGRMTISEIFKANFKDKSKTLVVKGKLGKTKTHKATPITITMKY